jgi:hypothetical protein
MSLSLLASPRASEPYSIAVAVGATRCMAWLIWFTMSGRLIPVVIYILVAKLHKIFESRPVSCKKMQIGDKLCHIQTIINEDGMWHDDDIVTK